MYGLSLCYLLCVVVVASRVACKMYCSSKRGRRSIKKNDAFVTFTTRTRWAIKESIKTFLESRKRNFGTGLISAT